jgi:NAD-dependent dihydropyrimidine dehydrogenase PreA subunit/protein involved in ribonucleotide reduction
MIIYFSGTGNSRYVAESIALQTDDEIINAAEYIKSGKRADFKSDKPYVFVCPTYAWRIPKIFSDFILSCSFCGNENGYFVMTCGDDIGNASAYLEKLSEKIHLHYRGVARVLMPENYIAMFPVTGAEEAVKIISTADKFIPTVSKLISSDKDFPHEKDGIFAKLKSSAMNPFFYKFINSKGFKVSDKCVGCGKCEELCPLNNVKLKDGKPVYGENCTHCMACISACPTEAIEYKKTSVGQPRYYNTKSPK